MGYEMDEFETIRRVGFEIWMWGRIFGWINGLDVGWT